MTRDELEVCRRVQRRVEREEERLTSIREMLEVATGRIDGLPRAKFSQSRIDALVAKLIDCEKTIAALKGIWVDCIQELNDLLNAHVSKKAQRIVLLRRYGYVRPFEVISRELGYSEAHVYTLHRKGLRELGL